MNLSACAGRTLKLTYWHSYKFAELTYLGTPYKDGGIVQISKDSGASWTAAPITTSGTIAINWTMSGGYDCLGNSSSSFLVHGKPGYVGSNGGWQKAEFTIPSDYLVSGFAVRFAYGFGVIYQTSSAEGSRLYTEPGWYLDDVSVDLP